MKHFQVLFLNISLKLSLIQHYTKIIMCRSVLSSIDVIVYTIFDSCVQVLHCNLLMSLFTLSLSGSPCRADDEIFDGTREVDFFPELSSVTKLDAIFGTFSGTDWPRQGTVLQEYFSFSNHICLLCIGKNNK